MRDFRDAKVMAQAIRATLAAKGLKISVSQSLELIAKAFGAADWNTLSATINADPVAPGRSPGVVPAATGDRPLTPERDSFCEELKATLSRALAEANRRSHEQAALEHLLLALVDDKDACEVFRACRVDLHSLKRRLADGLDKEVKGPTGAQAAPTPGFQRVIQRAVLHVRASGRTSLTGAQVLVAIFSEQESRAAQILGEQPMTRLDAVNFMRSRDTAA